jgi:hypothetical protein
LTGNNNTNMSPGMLALIEIEGNDWTDLKQGTNILLEYI